VFVVFKDLYPDLELPKQSYPEFNEAVEAHLKKQNYVITEAQVFLFILGVFFFF
jgi:hypothetical protein